MHEFRAFAANLSERFRTIALLCVCLGLRISECLALKWSDVDWLNGWLRVERGVVEGNIDSLKSEESPWIQANYLETQITYIRKGDKADIKVDAFPGVVPRADSLSGKLLPCRHAERNLAAAPDENDRRLAISSTGGAQDRPGRVGDRAQSPGYRTGSL